MDSRSPIGASSATGSTRLSTGTDSPVSAASSTCRLRERSSRTSAGRLSPEASSTTSPGTSSAASTSCCLPSRSTTACGASRWRIACSAASALPSWTKPISALRTTTAAMTPLSIQWPIAAVTPAATISTISSRLLNCRPSRTSTPGGRASVRRFGPWTFRRRAASSRVRPCGSACSAASTASASMACQAGAGLASGDGEARSVTTVIGRGSGWAFEDGRAHPACLGVHAEACRNPRPRRERAC